MSDILSKTEDILTEYFQSADLNKKGLPTVKYLAEKVHLSAGLNQDEKTDPNLTYHPFAPPQYPLSSFALEQDTLSFLPENHKFFCHNEFYYNCNF